MSRVVDGVLIPDADARRALRAKKKAGQLPPRRCPASGCHKNLRDRNVPPRYRHYEETFGLAVERPIGTSGMAEWECPFCQHRFGKHRMPQ